MSENRFAKAVYVYFATLEDKQDAQTKADAEGVSLSAWLLKNSGYEVNRRGAEANNKRNPHGRKGKREGI